MYIENNQNFTQQLFCIKIPVMLVSALIDQSFGTRQMTLAITHPLLDFTLVLPTKKHSNNEVVALALFNITCCDYMLVLKHQFSSYYTHTANLHQISRLPHSLGTALRAHIFSQRLSSWWMSWLPKQHCNVKNFLASCMIFDTCYLHASDFN